MKNKNFIKYFLAFFIPFIILILFCISRKIGIFGDYSLLISDFQAQYIVLLKHIREGGSILYSLSKGLGGGMIGTFAYYLSSPLNIFIYLFPKDQIVLASIFLIVLRISLSGLTMFTYLTNHFKECKYKTLMFSTCYALMAYVVNYHFHIMWLDGIMLLPLIMMGIDKLFEKKSTLYIISLFLAIFSNYYIGYMICILSVIYFIGNVILKYSCKKDKKEIKEVIIKFIISSLLSGLMTMILQIPNILELKNGYKANSEGLDYSGFNFSFLDLWSRTYISSHNANEILAKEVISIYCGLIVLPLLYFYFINKKISKKEKFVYGIMLLVLLLGYFINAIGMIYHGFNYTNCFNYRFSFLICFVMILMACKSFKYIKEIKIHQYLMFYIFYLIMSLVMYFSNYSYLGTKAIYISCAIVGIYMVLLYLYDRYDKNKDIKILLFAIVFAELLFNLFSSLEKFEYHLEDEFEYYSEVMRPDIGKLQISNQEYRIETIALSTHNSSFFFNTHGINSFLSTTDVNHLQFLKNAGFQSTGMSALDNDNNTALIDSILGIKYRITPKNKKLYNTIGSINYPLYSGILFHPTVVNDATIYENPYALSLGYTIATNYSDKNVVDDPFDFQNYILNNMLGNDKEYFKPYERNKLSEGAYEFIIDNDEDVYIYYMFNAVPEECDILINGTSVNNKSEIFLYKGDMNSEKIRVSLDGKVLSYGGAVAYYFDSEEFIKDIKTLQNNNVKFETVEDGYIKGKVNITKDFNRLFFSIPYEDGWTLYVDGKETDIDMIYDAFMVATLEEGEHEIELKYSVPGLKIGIVVSTISLTLTGLYLYFEKKSSKKVK